MQRDTVRGERPYGTAARHMFWKKLSLRHKVSLYLILALSPALMLLPYVNVTYHKQDLQEEIARHATQIAELIVKSTRYAMLVNERDIAEKIIGDIGRQDRDRARAGAEQGRHDHPLEALVRGSRQVGRAAATSPACIATRADETAGAACPTSSAGASTRRPTVTAPARRRWRRFATSRPVPRLRVTSTRRTSRCWASSTSPTRSTQMDDSSKNYAALRRRADTGSRRAGVASASASCSSA